MMQMEVGLLRMEAPPSQEMGNQSARPMTGHRAAPERQLRKPTHVKVMIQANARERKQLLQDLKKDQLHGVASRNYET